MVNHQSHRYWWLEPSLWSIICSFTPHTASEYLPCTRPQNPWETLLCLGTKFLKGTSLVKCSSIQSMMPLLWTLQGSVTKDTVHMVHPDGGGLVSLKHSSWVWRAPSGEPSAVHWPVTILRIYADDTILLPLTKKWALSTVGIPTLKYKLILA